MFRYRYNGVDYQNTQTDLTTNLKPYRKSNFS